MEFGGALAPPAPGRQRRGLEQTAWCLQQTAVSQYLRSGQAYVSAYFQRRLQGFSLASDRLGVQTHENLTNLACFKRPALAIRTRKTASAFARATALQPSLS